MLAGPLDRITMPPPRMRCTGMLIEGYAKESVTTLQELKAAVAGLAYGGHKVQSRQFDEALRRLSLSAGKCPQHPFQPSPSTERGLPPLWHRLGKGLSPAAAEHPLISVTKWCHGGISRYPKAPGQLMPTAR